MMKRLIIYISAGMMLLAGCARTEDADRRPVMLVSIEPQRKMLEDLAGDRYNVVTMLSKGANPETYEPTVQQRMQAAQAQAYFTVGYLPFESTISQSLGAGVPVVDTSVGITTISGTHTHDGETHSEVDPHVWTSLVNGKVMARNMLDALVRIDPQSRDYYTQRYDSLVHRLDSLDKLTAQRLGAARVHAFAVWHPSLSYYAHDYGLHQVSVGQESKETSLGQMRSVIDHAREDSVRVFFFQREFDSRQAESINREIGSRLVVTDPLAYDWEQTIMQITDELTR